MLHKFEVLLFWIGPGTVTVVPKNQFMKLLRMLLASCVSLGPYNKAIKSVPSLWPSTGRPCQGAAYGGR